MKWNYIATAFAALLLIVTGVYWFNHKTQTQDYWQPTEPQEYREVVDGKEFTLDHPLTESFSNTESNKDVITKKVASTTSSKKNTTGSVVKKAVQTVASNVNLPFVVGMYYLDTLREHNFTGCKASSNNNSSSDERGKYISETGDFEITDVRESANHTFIFVEADSEPEDLCARLMIFKHLKNVNPVHIFID